MAHRKGSNRKQRSQSPEAAIKSVKRLNDGNINKRNLRSYFKVNTDGEPSISSNYESNIQGNERPHHSDPADSETPSDSSQNSLHLSQSRPIEDMLHDALSTQPNSQTNSDSTKDNSPSTETQLKIYADHLETQIVSLKTERDLLNDELRAAEKNIKSLTEKNKKLTQENDNLLRNKSKMSGTRRFTNVSTISSQTSPQEINDLNMEEISRI